MIEYYKNIKKMNEIPKIILYFSSNQNINNNYIFNIGLFLILIDMNI